MATALNKNPKEIYEDETNFDARQKKKLSVLLLKNIKDQIAERVN